MSVFTLSKSDEIGELAKGLLAFHKEVGTIAKTATNRTVLVSLFPPVARRHRTTSLPSHKEGTSATNMHTITAARPGKHSPALLS